MWPPSGKETNGALKGRGLPPGETPSKRGEQRGRRALRPDAQAAENRSGVSVRCLPPRGRRRNGPPPAVLPPL